MNYYFTIGDVTSQYQFRMQMLSKTTALVSITVNMNVLQCV